jgi:hypothetical protein
MITPEHCDDEEKEADEHGNKQSAGAQWRWGSFSFLTPEASEAICPLSVPKSVFVTMPITVPSKQWVEVKPELFVSRFVMSKVTERDWRLDLPARHEFSPFPPWEASNLIAIGICLLL